MQDARGRIEGVIRGTPPVTVKSPVASDWALTISSLLTASVAASASASSAGASGSSAKAVEITEKLGKHKPAIRTSANSERQKADFVFTFIHTSQTLGLTVPTQKQRQLLNPDPTRNQLQDMSSNCNKNNRHIARSML